MLQELVPAIVVFMASRSYPNIPCPHTWLVKVYKQNTNESTFDDLRCAEYRRNYNILELPPTSHSIVNGHIPRWYFIVKELSNLLNFDYQHGDPLRNGWKIENYDLLPEKNLILIPDFLTYTCNCKVKDSSKRCRSNQCKCKYSRTLCTEFCGCHDKCCNR